MRQMRIVLYLTKDCQFLCEKYKKKKSTNRHTVLLKVGKQPFGNSGYLEYSNK